MYLEKDDRKIYLSSSIDEIYYFDNNEKHVLKDYIENTYQTAEDGIKHVTDLMEETATLKDGGTKIYRSEEYDLTIITCNRIKMENDNNKDIYIGDYRLVFNNNMCNR